MADGSDEDFALKLVGDGISIEKKANRQIAMPVVAAVLSGGAATAPVERVEANDPHAPMAASMRGARPTATSCEGLSVE